VISSGLPKRSYYPGPPIQVRFPHIASTAIRFLKLVDIILSKIAQLLSKMHNELIFMLFQWDKFMTDFPYKRHIVNEILAGRFLLYRCSHWRFREMEQALSWDL